MSASAATNGISHSAKSMTKSERSFLKRLSEYEALLIRAYSLRFRPLIDAYFESERNDSAERIAATPLPVLLQSGKSIGPTKCRVYSGKEQYRNSHLQRFVTFSIDGNSNGCDMYDGDVVWITRAEEHTKQRPPNIRERAIEGMIIIRHRTAIVVAVHTSSSQQADVDDDDDADDGMNNVDEHSEGPSLITDLLGYDGLWYVHRGPSRVSYQRQCAGLNVLTSSKYRGHRLIRNTICRLADAPCPAEPPTPYVGWIEHDTPQRLTYYYHSSKPQFQQWERPNESVITLNEYERRHIEYHTALNKYQHDIQIYQSAIQTNQQSTDLLNIYISNEEQYNINQTLSTLSLNDRQRDAISHAILHRVALIHGPPGTGKTRTAVHLLAVLARTMKRKPLLASAFSNIGLDQLVIGLLSLGINVIRIGVIDRINSSVKHVTLQSMMDDNPRVRNIRLRLDQVRLEVERLVSSGGGGEAEFSRRRELNREYKRLLSEESSIERGFIESSDVVCCTCIGAGYDALNGMTFDTVVVDECTQATEPSAIVPIVMAEQRIVLFGDHCQLPPTMTTEAMRRSPLQISLFERLLNGGITPNVVNNSVEIGDDGWVDHLVEVTDSTAAIKPFMLTVQYRMHPRLSQWPNQTFYHNRLIDAAHLATMTIPKSSFPWPQQQPLAFLHNVSPESSARGDSRSNVGEAQSVVDIVRTLLSQQTHGPPLYQPSHIGVISFYAGQVALLQRMLRGHPVEVNSVDGYQGRECRIIILSCVRSNDRGRVGFLEDRRRMNVALTRAQEGLIIVGNINTLQAHPLWAKFIRYLRQYQCIITPEPQQMNTTDYHSGQQ